MAFKFNTIHIFIARISLMSILWVIASFYNWINNSGLNEFVIRQLIHFSEEILHVLNFNPFVTGDIIGLKGTLGLKIGAPCNGIDIILLFAAIIVALPGKIINKLLYLFIGLVVIHSFNIIRIVSLVIIHKWKPSMLDFNHTYTFTLSMYLLIFCLWVYWVNKFSVLNIARVSHG